MGIVMELNYGCRQGNPYTGDSLSLVLAVVDIQRLAFL